MNRLDGVRSQFSIKNLESLSGIKAHTIRIWEKRYNLLSPDRTDTNIRYYDQHDLQKLLNIALLYNKGYKISKIAALEEAELMDTVRKEISQSESNDHYMSSLKLSMLNYDQALFEHTYTKLINERSFREIFIDVFIPLLEEIGFLWQVDSITPAHEHFITNLIVQKLQVNIERVQRRPPENGRESFVLFLPLNEIHELGLLYLHYELLLAGYQSVYLGLSVPVESLQSLKKLKPNVIYVSYFTVEPETEQLTPYLKNFEKEILEDTDAQLWVLGRQTEAIDQGDLHTNVKLFNKIEELLNKIKS